MTVLRFILVFAVSMLFAVPKVSAQQVNRAAVERQFQNWLLTDILPQARRRGVSRKTFNAALSGVTLNWELPDLVPPGTKQQTPRKQSQAEFRSPSRYFSENVLGGVISGGRSRLAKHKNLLAALERQTGVPGRIAIAIWGRESGFGRAKIPYDVFQVLATKAFMSTRTALFEPELIAALEMAQKPGITPQLMKSSWAGALGQPQFLPTSYLEHAADGDGDGNADIWRSEADTLASIANYLRNKNWVAGRDWGFEVKVPETIPCYLEGPDRGKPISEWVKMGVTRVSGRPFPDHELSQPGFLLMPAGRYGPAFIVTPNFYVLKEYNESDVYALFVGHAGDRIQYGGNPFRGDWRPIDSMLRSEIAAMQRVLENQNYDVGGADGLPGFKTRRSIGEWQAKNGFPASCFPGKSMLTRIR